MPDHRVSHGAWGFAGGQESEELASKEVSPSKWRNSEGEKSKKRVVLDAAAAAVQQCS
jgi:hypothetical protein